MFVGFASIVRVGSMSVSPLSRLLPRSLRSEHSASGGAISAHATHQTVCHRVIGTSLQRLQRTGQSTHSKKNEGQKLQSESALYLPENTVGLPTGRAALQAARLLWERDPDISVFTKYVFSSPLPFTLMIPRHVHV